MRRKKSTKRPANRSSVKKQILSSESVEKDFLSKPAQLTRLLLNEVKPLKQQKMQLKNQLKEEALQLVVTNKRIQSLAEAKPSAAKAKQLTAAKNAAKKCSKSMAMLNKHLANIETTINKNMQKQTKMTELKKVLVNFEKTWVQQSKKSSMKTSDPKLSIVETSSTRDHSGSFANDMLNNNIEQTAESSS